ncbi:YtrH family sporulation protein [Defluviitalea phaphyphila]|uniref:YtrH family sporulation protein n=1 Tax=Defluviitalea phaphyphila TaxID=1473580 RepID=UPI00073094B6|nr:YtrH family sporulation protein [Defluviitalea phaphyphila]
MSKLLCTMVYNFFIALGVIIGGALFGSAAAILCNEKPINMMMIFAEQLKLWAIIVALGGTFPTFEILDLGILKGEFKAVIKQILYILSAFSGAHIGYMILNSLGVHN